MSGSALQQTRRTTRTLRDLLSESSIPSPSPSNGFKPIPRKPIPSTTMRSLIEMDINSSSRNSNPRIFSSLLNALVKKFYSFSQKHPSILAWSASRRLSRKTNSGNCRRSATEVKVPVRIKDIVRWRSFGDLDVENPQPLDSSSASSSCSSSKGSSWSESDFSSCDGNFVECSKNDKRFFPLVGEDSVHATTGNPAGPEGELSVRRQEEEEQRSPVSVLEIEEYERFSDIDDDEYEEGDESETMAWKLLQCAKSTSGSVYQRSDLEKLLLDFFKEEMKKRRVDENDELESEILRRTRDWMNGSFGDEYENSDKNACVRDMDERERWNKFEDEKQELACEIEGDILENLIVEAFSCSFSC
ncbi:hypothetical protein QN277_022774 [Acacia crassicarpa]|uniref:DUF4378 domain-containing protein n=1 Tax=Acacia crassicarpa TaxID=499986 RepID=A0AAE1KAE1_9FABA|nr:hypothetical protein QN277_022774 [Acacia crassicarpa]